MRSKLLFIVFVLLTLLLLPFGVKSRPEVQNPTEIKSFERLAPNPKGYELKGNSLDSDDLSRELV